MAIASDVTELTYKSRPIDYTQVLGREDGVKSVRLYMPRPGNSSRLQSHFVVYSLTN